MVEEQQRGLAGGSRAKRGQVGPQPQVLRAMCGGRWPAPCSGSRSTHLADCHGRTHEAWHGIAEHGTG